LKDQKEYFLDNLNFRIEERRHFYQRANPTFRSELNNCVERFESMHLRESYKILIKEFQGLNNSK
jgi:hypothetical protein